MHLFHNPELTHEFIALADEEAHHALAVLRLRVGDIIGLLDGRGMQAEARITELDRKHCMTRVLSRQVFPAERRSPIHMAVGLTKQMDRFEWFVEKAVEVGVDRITPLITERTERHRVRMDRLRKVMVAAMKQSRRKWLPDLDAATTLKELLQPGLSTQRYFGWCEGEHRSLMQAYTTEAAAIVLIGPEGDFTPEEAALLKENSFEAVGLGDARLRTETAALTACTWMSMAQQR